MPIIKAAIKDLRKSSKRRIVNRASKDTLKDAIKEIKKLATAKKMTEFAKQLPMVFSIIDKAAKNNLLHKRTAGRRKAGLSKMLAAAK